jgi:hypothetical protein
MSKPAPRLITRSQSKPDVRASNDAQKRAKTLAVLKAIAVLKRAGVPVPASLASLAPSAVKPRVSPGIRSAPRAKTIAAISSARRGELVTVGSVNELFADLNAND